MADQKRLSELKQNVDEVAARLNIKRLRSKQEDLTNQSQAEDFWNDNIAATKVMQEINSLQEQTEPWISLQQQLDELEQLAKMEDDSLSNEINNQLETLESKYSELKKQMRFSGPHDRRNAVLGIHAGAGGTDAQDWAQMLMRMYTRWAENNGMKAVLLDESAGEEAGIKSASLEISGPLAFGKLKSEHGVHRLVRQSPFNSDAKRQTSFAKVEVMPEIDEPGEVPIDEKDLKIDVFRAGGHGGQSVNTTDSAVRITHLPTNIVVSIQNERSQLQNKETAMKILRSKLAQLQMEQHAEKISELKGPNEQAAWGNQIRSYVMHPYSMVKDLRTRYETAQVQQVLDGQINEFIDSYLEQTVKS